MFSDPAAKLFIKVHFEYYIIKDLDDTTILVDPDCVESLKKKLDEFTKKNVYEHATSQ